mgnify:CR=1 FL=1
MSNKYEIKLEWTNQDEFYEFINEIKKTHSKEETPFTVAFPMQIAHGAITNVALTFANEDGFWFEDWS